MAITSITTNTSAQHAAANVRQALSDSRTAAIRLSSGNQITKAADDATGLSIGTGLRGDVSTLKTNLNSASQASSILSIADGAHSNIADIMIRMKAIAIQANSGAMSATEKGYIDKEMDALGDEITRIANQTKFNGQALIDGTFTAKTFQVGLAAADTITVALADMKATTLGIDSGTIDVTTDAAAAITAIDTALGTLQTERATVGSLQSRFNFAAQNLETSVQNTDAARSVYLDADVANESTAFAGSQVKMQAGISVLAQANQLSANLLKLLG